METTDFIFTKDIKFHEKIERSSRTFGEVGGNFDLTFFSLVKPP